LSKRNLFSFPEGVGLRWQLAEENKWETGSDRKEENYGWKICQYLSEIWHSTLPAEKFSGKIREKARKEGAWANSRGKGDPVGRKVFCKLESGRGKSVGSSKKAREAGRLKVTRPIKIGLS